MALYAQTTGTQQTNSGTFVPIPGLTLTIPEGVGTSALIILNVPMPYAQGNNYPGGTFGITVGGTAYACGGGLHLQRPESREHRPHPHDTGRERAAGRRGADC